MKYKFGKDFTFGAAVWAQGTEGAYDKDGKSLNVYEKYALEYPSRMQGGIGPFETLNFYEDYKKYVDLMEKMGLESYRTSITWSRLIPDGINVNEKAVEFYTNYFKYIKSKGIKLWITLYWFDMPLHLEDIGGFSNRKVIDVFRTYVRTCYKLFSEYVDIFYIYNEPQVDINFKYLLDFCYPFELDFNKAVQTQFNMLVAHAYAVKEFRDLGITGTKISSVINVPTVYARSTHPSDMKAKYYQDLFGRDAWLDPLIKGIVPKGLLDFYKDQNLNIEILEGDIDLISKYTVDCIAFNSYGPYRVKAKEHMLHPDAPITYDSFSDNYVMQGRRMNKYRGWEIYPKHIYDLLIYVKNTYDNIECYITENGIGVQEEWKYRGENGEIEDDYRIDFIKEHIGWCGKAIEEGCNLKGYHMWSFIDLWSPTNQFLNTYGFVEYNLKTKESKFKKSAHWYSELIRKKELEVELI